MGAVQEGVSEHRPPVEHREREGGAHHDLINSVEKEEKVGRRGDRPRGRVVAVGEPTGAEIGEAVLHSDPFFGDECLQARHCAVPAIEKQLRQRADGRAAPQAVAKGDNCVAFLGSGGGRLRGVQQVLARKQARKQARLKGRRRKGVRMRT